MTPTNRLWAGITRRPLRSAVLAAGLLLAAVAGFVPGMLRTAPAVASSSEPTSPKLTARKDRGPVGVAASLKKAEQLAEQMGPGSSFLGERLIAQFSELTPDLLRDALDQLMAQPRNDTRDAILKCLITAWTRTDGAGAAEYFLTRDDDSILRGRVGFADLVKEWAKTDPDGILKWLAHSPNAHLAPDRGYDGWVFGPKFVFALTDGGGNMDRLDQLVQVSKSENADPTIKEWLTDAASLLAAKTLTQDPDRRAEMMAFLKKNPQLGNEMLVKLLYDATTDGPTSTLNYSQTKSPIPDVMGWIDGASSGKDRERLFTEYAIMLGAVRNYGDGSEPERVQALTQFVQTKRQLDGLPPLRDSELNQEVQRYIPAISSE